MNRKLMIGAAALLAVTFSVKAQADPPDPTPGATKPIREQNLDENDWIAVHEQGVADVEVTGGQIDANITGGSVEAEIIGGEVEVSNEVKVKITTGEVIDVGIVANSSTIPWMQDFKLSTELAFISCNDVFIGNDGPIHITSVACWAESENLRIGEDLVIGIYAAPGNTGLTTLQKGAPADFCAPFSRPYSDGSILEPTYRTYCKSDSSWITYEDYLYVCLEGEPFPVPLAHCRVHGEIILE